METEKQNALLPHLERTLGSFMGSGFAEPEWNVPFSAFRWPNSPETGINTLVSFGLGRHVLQGRRQEILLALRPTWDEVAVHIMVSVGMYVYVDDVDAHYARAHAAGAEVEGEPVDQPSGVRSYGAIDAEGHQWWFVKPI